MLRIQGVHNYTPQDLAAAVQFLAGCCAQYPFEGLGAHFPLTEVNAAFRYAREAGVFRVAAVPR